MSMPADRQPGKIVTFYSYKGGTGRTMALANIAWILASNGRRVLAVDWDLEAPGLHRYFHPFLVDPELAGSTGVMDMVWDYALATLDTQGDPSPGWHEPYADVLNHTVSLRWDFERGGVLSLLSAGRQDDAYGAKVNSFDWSSFYDKRGGGAFVEAMKQSMAAQYDYVLIDSRTGLSDTAGICTVQLPDILVTCFTFSTQSIAGTAAVVESVRRQRGERDITIWPVPMRVEDGETAKLEASRDLARIHLDHLLKDLDENARDRYWGAVEVPYKTLYAYEETLATVGDRPNQRGTILAASEQLTGYLTDQEIVRQVPLDESERRQLARQFQRQPRTTPEEFAADSLMARQFQRQLMMLNEIKNASSGASSQVTGPQKVQDEQDEQVISLRILRTIAEEFVARQFQRQPRTTPEEFVADFLISYATEDQNWAEWVAWQLEDAGYRVLIQSWDTTLGASWTATAEQALSSSRRIVAIVSRSSVRSDVTRAQWQAVLRSDPNRATRKIIPVRVEDVPLPDFLSGIFGFDLWGLEEDSARNVLLNGIVAATGGATGGRAKPVTRPRFPSLGKPEPGAGRTAQDRHPRLPFPSEQRDN
ncbi:KGGVGR-motif variant AAA ATPase [Frankia sp. CiP3]|uniref:KGGVGR-motif variant AAA ATPase n=1 Tax=Frankia sp. CiP3 TaxID=2880971 RepID=UPI001EF435E5|nr:TIR domain-containing protein [Frankia sp. CiP3]